MIPPALPAQAPGVCSTQPNGSTSEQQAPAWAITFASVMVNIGEDLSAVGEGCRLVQERLMETRHMASKVQGCVNAVLEDWQRIQKLSSVLLSQAHNRYVANALGNHRIRPRASIL